MRSMTRIIATTILIASSGPAFATGAGEPIKDFSGKGLFSSIFGSDEVQVAKKSPLPVAKPQRAAVKKADADR